MRIERKIPKNKNYPYVLIVYSGHSWVFDLERKEQIEGLFYPSKTSTLTVFRNKIEYQSESPFGLSDVALEQLLRPLMLVTERRYAAGIDWLNEGNGYTESELRDYIDESMTSEAGLDDLFGDLAVAPTVIESLLDTVNKME